MAQYVKFAVFLGSIPFAVAAVLIASAVEVVTGNNPLEDDDDGIQRSPLGPVRPAGGHRRGRNNNCPCGTTHD